MTAAMHLVFRSEEVDFPAGAEAIGLETLALAVEIADDEAQTVVRSYGRVKRKGAATLFVSPQHNPAVEALFARACEYLVQRGIARRITAKSVAL